MVMLCLTGDGHTTVYYSQSQSSEDITVHEQKKIDD
jgi:hypothetical protein